MAEYGTIATTARACSLTPSAVSQQLSLLEQEVGSPLFIRVGRTLVLTEAARTLVEHTERVLEVLEEAGAAVAELSPAADASTRTSACCSPNWRRRSPSSGSRTVRSMSR